MSTEASMKTFLSSPFIAVVGASSNTQKFGHKSKPKKTKSQGRALTSPPTPGGAGGDSSGGEESEVEERRPAKKPKKEKKKWFQDDSDDERAQEKAKKHGRKVIEAEEPETLEDLEALAAGLLEG